MNTSCHTNSTAQHSTYPLITASECEPSIRRRMDDQSYDGTEQTPQPKSFRPPPMMMHHPSGIMNVETPQSVITPPMTATRSPPTMVLSSSSFGRQESLSHRTTAVASLESTYYSDYHPDYISTTTTTTRDATTTVPPLPPSPLLQSSRRRRPHAPSSAAGKTQRPGTAPATMPRRAAIC